MAQLTVSVDVSATPERTFEVFTDLSNAADNIRGIQKMEILTDGPVGIGTRFRETRVMMGKEATEDMEIIEFNPGESFAHEANSHGCHYLSTYRFEPTGEGTRASLTFEGRGLTLFAKIMSAALGWMMTGMMRKCIAQDLDDLKAVAEGHTAAT